LSNQIVLNEWRG